jgi:hypothetical protein
MVKGKARSLNSREASESCFTRVGSDHMQIGKYYKIAKKIQICKKIQIAENFKKLTNLWARIKFLEYFKDCIIMISSLYYKHVTIVNGDSALSVSEASNLLTMLDSSFTIIIHNTVHRFTVELKFHWKQDIKQVPVLQNFLQW